MIEDYRRQFHSRSFEPVSIFNNGYFYTFYYDSIHKDKFVDKNPFIFCIGPCERFTKKGKSVRLENIIAGLNLHHLTISEREKLVNELTANYSLLEDDAAHILSEETLNKLVPGAIDAVRYYHLAHVYDLHRLRNKYVPFYLREQGNIIGATVDEAALRHEFTSVEFKSSDHL